MKKKDYLPVRQQMPQKKANAIRLYYSSNDVAVICNPPIPVNPDSEQGVRDKFYLQNLF